MSTARSAQRRAVRWRPLPRQPRHRGRHGRIGRGAARHPPGEDATPRAAFAPQHFIMVAQLPVRTLTGFPLIPATLWEMRLSRLLSTLAQRATGA
jgi:hypothetical protein